MNSFLADVIDHSSESTIFIGEVLVIMPIKIPINFGPNEPPNSFSNISPSNPPSNPPKKLL